MICPHCKKNPASVHVTEIGAFQAQGDPANEVREHHLCEGCAQQLNLPHAPVPNMTKVWKLLQIHAKQAKIKIQASTLSCQACGMSLEELRRRGRVGCGRCYEVFQEYLDELLERMHGARAHVGRLPGVSEDDLQRMQRVGELRHALDAAIREEDYERAALLRDELKGLQTEGPTSV
jgi:protein arginine kinase activator